VSDLLLMDKINALPHPLFVEISRGWWWPVHDIDVETGLLRIDVVGKLDVHHFGGMLKLRDANGVEYNTDDFYNEDSP
jgi:hypothetical protein